MPERIQLRRTKGYRKPPGAIVVARPTKWGNPFKAVRCVDGGWAVEGNGIRHMGFTTRLAAVEFAVNHFKAHVEHGRRYGWNTLRFSCDDLTKLTGHDLACWCPLDQPCHADVLLELANS